MGYFKQILPGAQVTCKGLQETLTAARLESETGRQLPVSPAVFESQWFLSMWSIMLKWQQRLRCNRGYPCGTCVQRHKQSSCEYAANANRNKTARSSLGDRLQKLENAVFQIAQHGVTINSGESETRNSKDATTALGDSSQKLSADTSGSLHVHDSQMTYVDSNHWRSILDDIKEVREQLCLSNNQLLLDQQVEERSPERELDLMFSPMPSHDIREILHSLPPRHVCDSLLSLYFNWRFMILREFNTVKPNIDLTFYSHCSPNQIPERVRRILARFVQNACNLDRPPVFYPQHGSSRPTDQWQR